MVQIINRGPSIGGNIGSAIGRGLGSGLEALAQHRIDRMVEEKNAQKFAKTLKQFNPNLTDQEAYSFAKAPEFIQKELFERGLVSNGQEYQQPEYGVQKTEDIIEEGPEINPKIQEISVKQDQSPRQFKLGLTKEEQKRLHEDQKEINKEVYPFIKEVQSKAKAAKENDLRLDRMEKLIETGKLNNPQFSSFLKTLKHGIWNVGIDLTSLLSPESQEFDKLSADFVKNAKDLFGSRVTDQDLKAFLATVPTLSQSNQGKLSVINNLKIFNRAAEIRQKAARELLKKYGNRPPLDFEAQVEDLAKNDLDELAKEFESGLGNKEATGTSHLISDVLGATAQPFLARK